MELKPCPFCGVPMNGKNHLFGWHQKDCFLILLEEPPFVEDMTDEEFKAALAEAWNHRAGEGEKV